MIDPDTYWDGETVEGMTAIQRAVMYGPASSVGRRRKLRLVVNEDGVVATGEGR